MKKLMILVIAVGLVMGVSSAMAKNDKEKNEKANPGKVLVCHFTKAGHPADYDFLIVDQFGEEIEGARECCDLFRNELGIKTVEVPAAYRGWERGHKGQEQLPEECTFGPPECMDNADCQDVDGRPFCVGFVCVPGE